MCNHIPLINFHYTMCFCYCTYFSIYFLCKKLLFFNYFSLFIHILYKKIVPIFRLLFLQYQACIWLQPFPFSLLSANHPHRLPYFPVLHRLIQLQHFHPLIPIQPPLFRYVYFALQFPFLIQRFFISRTSIQIVPFFFIKLPQHCKRRIPVHRFLFLRIQSCPIFTVSLLSFQIFFLLFLFFSLPLSSHSVFFSIKLQNPTDFRQYFISPKQQKTVQICPDKPALPEGTKKHVSQLPPSVLFDTFAPAVLPFLFLLSLLLLPSVLF